MKVGVPRFVPGRRTADIERTLDRVVASRFDLAGASASCCRRDAAASSHRRWREANIDKALSNSRIQARRFLARARVEWLAYCDVYRAKFPSATPPGFDRWRRTLRHAWLQRGESAVVLDVVRGLREQIAHSVRVQVEARELLASGVR